MIEQNLTNKLLSWSFLITRAVAAQALIEVHKKEYLELLNKYAKHFKSIIGGYTADMFSDSEAKQKLFDSMIKSIENEDTYKAKTNSELADLVISNVWADIDMFSPKSDLLDEVVDRLRNYDKGKETGKQ
jgi:hypothetical protein